MLADDFAVILLDVRMSEMDGFETAELIRQRERSERTPIIFVTASGEHDTNLERGYNLGAVDFIFAPIVPDILRAKVTIFDRHPYAAMETSYANGGQLSASGHSLVLFRSPVESVEVKLGAFSSLLRSRSTTYPPKRVS